MGPGRGGRIRCLGDGGEHLVKGSIDESSRNGFEAFDDCKWAERDWSSVRRNDFTRIRAGPHFVGTT